LRRAQIDSGSQPVRNLVSSPDMERTSGTTATRQNLVTYPNFEGVGGSVNVRTNLCTNPRGVMAMTPYSSAGAQVITGNVAITGHPEGITTANRFTYGGATPNNPGVQFFNGTAGGTNYTLSAWIYIESLATTPGTTGWAESGVLSGPTFANTVGVWQKVTWNRTTTSVNGVGIRTAAADGGSASILVTGIVIEAAPLAVASANFFDGATAPTQNLVKTVAASTGNIVFTENVPYQGQTWRRAAVAIGSADRLVRQSVALADLGEGGKTYTVAVTVANDGALAIPIRLDWCDMNTTTWTIQPGEVKRLVLTTSRSAYTSVYRFSDLSIPESPTEARSILYKDWLIEEGTTNGDYYSGFGDFTYAWAGAANASVSYQRATAAAGWAGSSSAVAYQTSIDPKIGAKCAAVVTKGGAGDGLYHLAIYTGISAFSVYTMSAWVKLTSAMSNVSLTARWQDSTATIIRDDSLNVSSSLVIGQWTRVSASFTAPAGAVRLDPMVRGYVAHTATTFYVDAVMIENNNILTEYFDGNTANVGDFTRLWYGTANASQSYEQAPSVGGYSGWYSGGRIAWQSTEWSASGTKSLAVAGLRPNLDSFSQIAPLPNMGIVGGKTFTFLANLRTQEVFPVNADGRAWSINISVNLSGGGQFQYNIRPTTTMVGVHEIRQSLKFRDDATTVNYMRLYNGSPNNVNVFWDNLMIVEGTYNGDYVDGSKPFSKWDGTANASTSVGYPQQFLDIAGKPAVDQLVGGNSGALTVDPYAPRTFYLVSEYLGNTSSYTATFLYGTIPNNGFNNQASVAGSNAVVSRMDFVGGDFNKAIALSNGRTTKRHVAAYTFPQGLTTATACMDGGTDVVVALNPGNGWADGRVITTYSGENRNIRALVFYAEHDRATRLAMSRYLGNKYGAPVA